MQGLPLPGNPVSESTQEWDGVGGERALVISRRSVRSF